MNDEQTLKIIQLITTAGAARSNYVEAIQAAKKSNFTEAKSLIEEGEEFFIEGHKFHAEFITSEAAGKTTEFSLLLIHAEDHLNSAETTKIMAEEVIEIYKKLNEQENKNEKEQEKHFR